jgi:hypothetical protein
MTVKEFLQQVFITYQEVDSKLEQMSRLQSLATRTTTVIHNTPCGGGNASSRIERAIIAIQGQSEYLADEINHLLDVRREVSEAISHVTDPAERRILEYRYLAFCSWKEISCSMKIGLRTVFRLHDKALKNFAAVSSWQ